MTFLEKVVLSVKQNTVYLYTFNTCYSDGCSYYTWMILLFGGNGFVSIGHFVQLFRLGQVQVRFKHFLLPILSYCVILYNPAQTCHFSTRISGRILITVLFEIAPCLMVCGILFTYIGPVVASLSLYARALHYIVTFNLSRLICIRTS